MRPVSLLALLIFTPVVSAQVGAVVKAGGSGGQIGLDLPVGDRASVRAITSLSIDVDRDDVSGVLNVAVPIRFPNGSQTALYLGPSLTVVRYEDFAFVGALFGVEHTLTQRITLFGEGGVDVGLDESYVSLTTALNTGVGAVFRF